MGGRRRLILSATIAAAAAVAAGATTPRSPPSLMTTSSPAMAAIRASRTRRDRRGRRGVGHDRIVDRRDRFPNSTPASTSSSPLSGGGGPFGGRHPHRRNAFLNLLMRVRGGQDSPPHDSDGADDYWDDVDDGVSAEELLDSIFDMDAEESPPRQSPTPHQSKSTFADHRHPSSSKTSESRPASSSSKSVNTPKANNVIGAHSDEDAKRLEHSMREKANKSSSRFINKAKKDGTVDLDGMHVKLTGRGEISAGNSKDVSDTRSISNSSANRITSTETARESSDTTTGVQINTSHERGLNEKDIATAETLVESRGRRKRGEVPRPGDRRRRRAASPAGADGDARAAWDPSARRRDDPPGPPPARATADERRARERDRRADGERGRLLSDLALSLHDSHVSAVGSLLRGSAARVPPALFGQSIAQERSACEGMFRDARGEAESSESAAAASGGDGEEEVEEDLHSSEPSFRHIEDPSLLSYWGLTPDAKLYGGAQYHRVLRYYHHLFLTAPLPPVTDDEVALLTGGVGEVHDASDLLRAVALLARHRMERVAEDVLADMTRRLLYVMDRQWEMVDYSTALHRPMGDSGGRAAREADLLRRHGVGYAAAEADLKRVLSAGFRKFAEKRAAEAYGKSLEDVRSLLRYINWDMGWPRDRVGKNQGRDRTFVSQIEVVSGDSADINDRAQRNGKTNGSHDGKKSNVTKRKKMDKKNPAPGRSNNPMVSRGGTDTGGSGHSKRTSERGNELNRSHGRRQLRTKGGDMSQEEGAPGEEEMGDLIGGVMNRGSLDAEHDDGAVGGEGGPPTSETPSASSRTFPPFGGDGEVLGVLLDAASSTLVPGLDAPTGRTRTAIEGLVSYVTNRTRMDVSRIVRGKFNAFFLLAFFEDLGPYLRRELDEYLATQCLDG